jgi:hypothetical protein
MGDPLRSVVAVRFAAAKRDADAVHSPESGVTKKADISYASCPVSLASRTKNPLMALNTIHSVAPLAAGLLQLNPLMATIDLTT